MIHGVEEKKTAGDSLRIRIISRQADSLAENADAARFGRAQSPISRFDLRLSGTSILLVRNWLIPPRTILALVFALAFPGPASAASPQAELIAACQRGDLAAAQWLVKNGAAIKGTDEENRTPLLAAVFSKKAELVAWLLRKVKLGETDSLEMRFMRVSPGIVIDSD